jgi:hypothetical protein
VLKCLDTANVVLLLVPIGFLHSKTRRDQIFTSNKPTKIFVIPKIPYWHDGVWKKGGMAQHIWVLFDKNSYAGITEMVRV